MNFFFFSLIDNSQSKLVVIVAACGGGLLLLIILVVVVACCCSQKRKGKRPMKTSIVVFCPLCYCDLFQFLKCRHQEAKCVCVSAGSDSTELTVYADVTDHRVSPLLFCSLPLRTFVRMWKKLWKSLTASVCMQTYRLTRARLHARCMIPSKKALQHLLNG